MNKMLPQGCRRCRRQRMPAPGWHWSFAQDSAPAFGGSLGSPQMGMGYAGANPQLVPLRRPAALTHS